MKYDRTTEHFSSMWYAPYHFFAESCQTKKTTISIATQKRTTKILREPIRNWSSQDFFIPISPVHMLRGSDFLYGIVSRKTGVPWSMWYAQGIEKVAHYLGNADMLFLSQELKKQFIILNG